MEKGRKIHDQLDNLYRDINRDYIMFSRDVGVLVEEYQAVLPDIPEMHKFLELEIKRFEDLRSKNSLKCFFPKFTEVYMEDKELFYFGTVDRVDKMEDGNYIVIDYKTGKFHSWLMTDYRFEMAGYKHLLEKTTVDGNVTRWAMIFLGGDEAKVVGETFKPITIRSFYNRVSRVRDGILAGLFDKKITVLCGYCPEVISDPCLSSNEKGVE